MGLVLMLQSTQLMSSPLQLSSETSTYLLLKCYTVLDAAGRVVMGYVHFLNYHCCTS